MNRIRLLLLIGAALAMLAVMILTWGSLGSAMMGYGLLVMAAALIYRKYLTNHDPTDFQQED